MDYSPFPEKVSYYTDDRGFMTRARFTLAGTVQSCQRILEY